MADIILAFGAHLSEGFGGVFRNENRIVTEAAASGRRDGDSAIDNAFEEIFVFAEYKSNDSAEPGVAIGYTVELGEELADVGCGIVARTGITRRVDTGSTAESIDFKTGVVGKTVIAISVFDPTGFLSCIVLKSEAGLGNVVAAADVLKTEDVEAALGQLTQFAEFMLIICSKDDFFQVCRISS